MAVMVRVKRGSLVVVSDASVFINSLLDENEEFLRSLMGRGERFLDSSHWEVGRLDLLRAHVSELGAMAGACEVRYGLLIALGIWLFRFKREGEVPTEEEVEEVLRRHPGWDPDVLRMLQGD